MRLSVANVVFLFMLGCSAKQGATDEGETGATAGSTTGGGETAGTEETGGGTGTGTGGEDPDWGDGEVEVCETQMVIGPLPPFSIDDGHPKVDPENGECPAGTQPYDTGCADAWPCACEYVCAPACGEREVCFGGDPDNVCGCHPVFDEQMGACVWTGVHANPSFSDGCAGWDFRVSDPGETGDAVTEVLDGRLHLAGTRCTMIAADTALRIPDASEFEGGTAIRFRFLTAIDGELAQDQPAPIRAHVRTQHFDLPTTENGAETFQTCVTLGEEGRLEGLGFVLESPGACADPLLLELWVDDLELVADPECG